MDNQLDVQYTDLLEIDTFRVVKDEKFEEARQKGVNNFTEHWIAHMCNEYKNNEDHDADQTGIFDPDEIYQGHCYYCKAKIPEAITALWSMLEWADAGEILHGDEDEPELYKVTPL